MTAHSDDLRVNSTLLELRVPSSRTIERIAVVLYITTPVSISDERAKSKIKDIIKLE